MSGHEKAHVVNDNSLQPRGSSYKLDYSSNSSNKILQRFTECTPYVCGGRNQWWMRKHNSMKITLVFSHTFGRNVSPSCLSILKYVSIHCMHFSTDINDPQSMNPLVIPCLFVLLFLSVFSVIGKPVPGAAVDSSPLGLKLTSMRRRYIQLCEDYTALGQDCSKTGGRMQIKPCT